ncbi:MAG: hypothetical protein AAF702_16720 [Chloroflexota bacterium]
MTDWDYNKPWWHGSPTQFTMLYSGSTITQNRRLAEVFSHKPTLTSIEDELGRIRHNGTQDGYLYQIDEEIDADDVYPHPETSMGWGLEWLTRRPIRVKLIGPVSIREDEYLSEADIAVLWQKAAERERE